MARSVDEWKGKTDDTPIPARVREKLDCGWRVSCDCCGAVFEIPYRMNRTRAEQPKFCSTECDRAHRRGKADAALKQRFWKRVQRGDPNECWEWSGRRDANGYGLIDIHGRPEIASRIAFELIADKALPRQISVCHHCDNPPCCNPRHLFAGTPADNMMDAYRKGRLQPFKVRRGEEHPQSKLTSGDVAAIRQSAKSVSELADRYSVSTVQIRNILSRRQWSHV